MAAAAAMVAVGLAVQVCAMLMVNGPTAVGAVSVINAPSSSLQRLTEAEWGSYHEVDHLGPGTYAFGYDVEDPETGNTQFRQEERHPNGTVTGSYGLVLPDGSVQIVHYTADHLGYRARIETKRPDSRLYPPAAVSEHPYAAPPPAAYAAAPQASAYSPTFRTQQPPAYAAQPQQSVYTAQQPQPSTYTGQQTAFDYSNAAQVDYASRLQPSANAASSAYTGQQPASAYFNRPQPSAYSGVPQAAAYVKPSPAVAAPSRTELPPLVSGQYQPVFWLPAQEAPPPFSVNHV